MLVFAAITPHPPLLIPSIGKTAAEKLSKTKEAMHTVEQELYASKPDLILIISPHGSFFPDVYTINAHTDFESDFEQFGNFSDKKKWKGSPEFAATISQEARNLPFEVRLVSEQKIDYGVSVPLFILTEHLSHISILPIGFTEKSFDDHLAFGQFLYEQIAHSSRRIAVIASADLSHALTKDSPAPYDDNAMKCDAAIQSLLESGNSSEIAAIDTADIQRAAQCGYRSILILLGILHNTHYTFKNSVYEFPFGVGYLTGYFDF